jgi:thiamine-phosphate pyrophosphorylase
MAAVDFTLCLITDRTQVPVGRTLVQTIAAALEGGVRAVQLREKELTAAELYPLALELRELTRRFGARLLINDRIDVALAVGADGVHLGGHSLPVAAARRILGDRLLIGASTHRIEEVLTAAAAGADFVTFGPVYATPSKLPYGDPLGLSALERACAISPVPLFALGGVTPERLPEVLATGCRHAACIGAILRADDPAGVASGFFSSLRGV